MIKAKVDALITAYTKANGQISVDNLLLNPNDKNARQVAADKASGAYDVTTYTPEFYQFRLVADGIEYGDIIVGSLTQETDSLTFQIYSTGDMIGHGGKVKYTDPLEPGITTKQVVCEITLSYDSISAVKGYKLEDI